jgi:hypothetical protein
MTHEGTGAWRNLIVKKRKPRAFFTQPRTPPTPHALLNSLLNMPRFITSSVVLLLVAAAGVIGGAQAEPTAVARPAARDSTAGRGWGHKNKGGRHKNKGGHHGAHFLCSPCPLLLLPSIPQELRDCVYTGVRATFTLRSPVSKRRAAVPRPPLRARAFILFFSLVFGFSDNEYILCFYFWPLPCQFFSPPSSSIRPPTTTDPNWRHPFSSQPRLPRAVCVGAEIEFDVALPAARGVVTAPCGGAVKCCDGFYCKQETDLNTMVDGQLITQESMIYEEFTSKSDQCCIPDVYYDVTKIACPREHYEILSETCDTAGFWSTGANNLACLCCEGTIERIVDAAKIGKIFCNTANDAISNDAGCCGEVPGASGLCP